MHVRTLPELLRRAVDAHDKADAVRYRRGGQYVDISSRELQRQVADVANGLLALGLAPGERVVLLSENRPEWIVADLAILSCGAVTVPVFPTLTADQSRYILENSEARICFVSTGEQLEKVLAVREGTRIERLVTLDAVDQRDPAVLSLEQLAAFGTEEGPAAASQLKERLEAIDPQGVATILYTSGTTGRPKGVMLSHDNILSSVRAALEVFEIGPSDVCLSFLPLSHMFERTAGYYAMLYAGATIAYAESVETVARDMLEVRPTIMNAVPRLHEKMYGRVLDAALAGSGLRRRLFLWAKVVGERVVERRLARRAVGMRAAAEYALASRLVFRKLRSRTGGRVRFFTSGGAPLAPSIARFFWAAGLPILEGYGLTETSPLISVNTFEAVRLGTVGRPVPGVEVRIAEDGEVLCKGPNVMLGYFRMPEETAAAMEDGWFRTGDIGCLDADGFLTITDRKKNLIKTSGGKYIAPQPIENALKLNQLVSQAVVLGDRRKFASLLIVPDFENLRKEAERAGIAYAHEADLLASADVRKLYDAVVAQVNRDLSQAESIKRFTLLGQEFSIESGELTPTLKVKRNVIEKKYREQIDAMYGEKLEV